MTANCYIRSAACISPQNTFGESFTPGPPHGTADRLTCIEPDYRSLIDPKALRRMSRIIRMGVATARACLHAAGVANPDAIVTGTAYGCLEDTGLFLDSLIQRKEEGLQPATFIQSTHNTVGAQIALLLQCTGYNNTFVHRGFSFESALLDAILLLKEGDAASVLAGAADELTDTSYMLLSRFGLYRHSALVSPGSSPDPALAAGEGTAFFLLSDQPDPNDWAKLEILETSYDPNGISLDAIDPAAIDLVIGDDVLPGKPFLAYKALCGEYPTSTAFALWLAAHYIKTGVHRRILVYNNYLHIHHSMFMVSTPGGPEVRRPKARY